MKTKLITTVCAGVLSALIGMQSAQACMRRMQPEPAPIPGFVGDSPHAAILKPIRFKRIEENGVRYWRAVYEVIARRDHPRSDDHERVAIEWSCDPIGGGADVCGAQVSQILIGFDSNGRPNEGFVQLELRWAHNSSYDGTPLFYASREGAMRLEAPIAFRDDLLENAVAL